jgi:hypothetical protein
VYNFEGNKFLNHNWLYGAILAILLLLLIGMVACASNDEAIYGYYQYDKTIYNNTLSSYLMTKENAPDYIITEDSFTILNTDGTQEKILTNFKKNKVDANEFANLFQPGSGMRYISDFQQRYQYIVNEVYRIYVMDNEIWLAQCADDTMWSIYRLVKTGDD